MPEKFFYCTPSRTEGVCKGVQFALENVDNCLWPTSDHCLSVLLYSFFWYVYYVLSANVLACEIQF